VFAVAEESISCRYTHVYNSMLVLKNVVLSFASVVCLL